MTFCYTGFLYRGCIHCVFALFSDPHNRIGFGVVTSESTAKKHGIQQLGDMKLMQYLNSSMVRTHAAYLLSFSIEPNPFIQVSGVLVIFMQKLALSVSCLSLINNFD